VRALSQAAGHQPQAAARLSRFCLQALRLPLGRSYTRNVEIKSISFLRSDKAQVRFVVYQRDPRNSNVKSEWNAIATLN
jgi:type IV secretory pathway component VirB8